METTNKKGIALVIDGGDGSGKSTQAQMLEERIGFKEFHLPDYSSPTGKMIRKAIDANKEGISEEYFQTLMTANYLDLFDNKIRPLLDQGQNVVISRAWDSMIAYSKSFGASHEFIEYMVRGFKGYLDTYGVDYRVVNIDIPVEVAMERISKRKGKKEAIFENYQTLSNVRESMKKTITHQIDGTQSVEEVYAEVIRKGLGSQRRGIESYLGRAGVCSGSA